ncbi:MAG: hypothetical protein J6D34_07250 [Atopobiaceae bacterium]|nr:hypothetical protein [Atopobiaceae bacterium]
MALCWPDKKVALDIVEEPVEVSTYRRKDGWTIVRVNSDDLVDYAIFRKTMSCVAELLGSEAPQDPEWAEKNRRLHAALIDRVA